MNTVKKGPPPHPDVAVHLEGSGNLKGIEETKCMDQDRSLICSIQALQASLGLKPGQDETIAAALALPFSFAAHDRDCPTGWSRFAGTTTLLESGKFLGLKFKALKSNLFKDDRFNQLYKIDSVRMDDFILAHRDKLLKELDAGNTVLVEGGFKGAIYWWGLITKYNASSDSFMGLVSGRGKPVELIYPPEMVLTAGKFRDPPVNNVCMLAQRAIGMIGPKAYDFGKGNGGWSFGKAAFDVWRRRLGEPVFCPICENGSWSDHKAVASALLDYITLLKTAFKTCPDSDVKTRTNTCLDKASAALQVSLGDRVEMLFESDSGKRRLAFDVLEAERALTGCFADTERKQER